jgi:hypothetical protein
MQALKLLTLCGLLALGLAACNDSSKKAENSSPAATNSTDTPNPVAPAATPATGIAPSVTPPNQAAKP